MPNKRLINKMYTRFISSIANTVHASVHSATANAILEKMDDVLTRNGISWLNCIGVSVNNMSVNLEKRNFITTRVYSRRMQPLISWAAPVTFSATPP